MAKSDTIFVSQNSPAKIQPFAMLLDDVRVLTVDLNAYLGAKSTSIASCSWDADDNGVAGIADAAVDGGTITCEVEAATQGATFVKASATLQSGELIVRKFYVTVKDPTTSSGLTDYSLRQ